ncbi:restriction endonuclease subunit S [Nonlabens ulvanivorans]|uniref:restriction endonuclease subunit S n=1 Tax=Nonlabens ulvanivorans TaxID=906888 RepID=UPI00294395E3|nr:restriction endonuclease subunit S [Nonlabens ulvanivorans]WOI21627.1 restriction endonuclease subunit S [Nonlabens ulvanivorans]
MEKQLPKGWVETDLDSIFNLKYGKGLPVKNLTETGYDVYGANGIIGAYSDYHYKEPRVIISCRGAASGAIHITNPESFITSNSIVLDEVKVDVLNQKYLFYIMKAVDKSDVITGTAQPQITIQLLKDLQIPLPPRAEQDRIVAKVDDLMAQHAAIQQAMERIPQLLKDFRQQVLTQAVTFKTTKKQSFKTIKDFEIEIKTGPFGSALHKSEYIDSGIYVINPSHIKDGEIIPKSNVSISNTKFQELKRWELKEGDVILGRRGEMGRCALYKSSYGKMICGTGSIILRENKNISAAFLDLYLRSDFVINYLETNSVGSTMINLNQKIINSLPFPNVSKEEQNNAISKLASLFEKATAIEQRYEQLKSQIDSLPQAILHKAFKGELVEQLDSDGSASELLKDISSALDVTKTKVKTKVKTKGKTKGKSKSKSKSKVSVRAQSRTIQQSRMI